VARKKVQLTKSRILHHRQCPKRLWLESYRPELAVQDDAATARMTAGTDAGEIARRDYPTGRLVEAKDRATALAKTKQLLSQSSRPLFEAAFEAGGVHVRADLLLPGRPGYQLVEVKSSLSVKDYHYEDVAIQSWVVTETGLSLKRVDVAHIDKTFVYPGGGDYRGLFKRVNVSNEARAFHKHIPKWILAAQRTLDGKQPETEIGDQCEDPVPCQFIEHCKSQSGVVEADYPVELLPDRDGKALAAALRAKGYSDLRKVPGKLVNGTKLSRIWRATRTRKIWLDPQAGRELKALGYPRYYFDFETFGPVVPIWVGTRPKQAIPFQWSCHIEQKTGKVKHKEYLADGPEDPRLDLTKSMIKALGTTGPIFTYSSYEATTIKGLIRQFPKLAGELNAILDRIEDLYPIAKKHYYHRDLRGSWSLKRVLPTIAPELDYSDLEVADGGMAQEAFSEMIRSETPANRRSQLRKALLTYCARDTLAVARVEKFLRIPPSESQEE